MAYAKSLLVRFPDVDFARVVYYPRFFDYCHQVFEDFFADEVGCAYPEMLKDRKVGFPSVHASADFKAPLRFGDTVRVELTVAKLSGKSATCRYALTRESDGQLCAVATVVVVAIDMDTFTGRELPDEVRAALQKHLAA